MNMNDSDWNEFWDDEAEDDRDDDEQNDVGSDVDANNDETFDNAAEWNEDEHEELIARDSILSQTARSNNHARENSRNINGRSRGRSNEVINNISLNDHSVGNENRREEFAFLATTVAWNNNNVADLINQAPNYSPNNSQNRFNSQNSSPQWHRSIDSTSSIHHMHLHQNPRDLIMRAREPSPPPSFMHDLTAKPHTTINEDSNSLLTPNAATCTSQRPKVIRVDDLERQLMKTSIGGQNVPNRIPPNEAASIPIQQSDQPKRSSWSPFGGKDLFTSTDSQQQQQARAQMNSQQQQNMMSQSLMSRQLSLEQQQRILLQQHQIVQQQQQLQQMALVKQQQELLQQQQLMAQQHQMRKQQQEPSRLLPQNAQCFTVEELERQMIADRSNNSKEPTKTIVVAPATTTTEKPANLHQQQPQHQRQPNRGQESRQNNSKQVAHNNSHDRRNGEKYHERSDQKQHQERTHRDRKDRRDHRDDRENRHYDSRRKLTIIPPQVQLSVIDKERRLHSLTTMHQDEFLQDIMPTSRTGFLFNRHSNVSTEKANHDGVLTEKERSWLTRIQEKIQADYDDNVDQDYYYLLYFNRSSMTEGATSQKPSGPGVLDRRFIPRERLLYNTSD